MQQARKKGGRKEVEVRGREEKVDRKEAGRERAKTLECE